MSKASVRSTRIKLADTIARLIEDHGFARHSMDAPDPRSIKQILNFGTGALTVTVREQDGTENSFAILVRQKSI